MYNNNVIILMYVFHFPYIAPKVPFEVSVSAETVAGTGKKQSKVLFTTEGGGIDHL